MIKTLVRLKARRSVVSGTGSCRVREPDGLLFRNRYLPRGRSRSNGSRAISSFRSVLCAFWRGPFCRLTWRGRYSPESGFADVRMNRLLPGHFYAFSPGSSAVQRIIISGGVGRPYIFVDTLQDVVDTSRSYEIVGVAVYYVVAV